VSGIYSTHLLSLDALLAVIDSIEQHCHHRILSMTSSSLIGHQQTASNAAAAVTDKAALASESSEGMLNENSCF